MYVRANGSSCGFGGRTALLHPVGTRVQDVNKAARNLFFTDWLCGVWPNRGRDTLASWRPLNRFGVYATQTSKDPAKSTMRYEHDPAERQIPEYHSIARGIKDRYFCSLCKRWKRTRFTIINFCCFTLVSLRFHSLLKCGRKYTTVESCQA